MKDLNPYQRIQNRTARRVATGWKADMQATPTKPPNGKEKLSFPLVTLDDLGSCSFMGDNIAKEREDQTLE
ncbi:MAG: hypothetical protein E5Y58_14210 [Mesorhizobium sp.]|nr:MAG: hypothetical protein E5Y58_14210 [Mesorhizobium sp.]